MKILKYAFYLNGKNIFISELYSLDKMLTMYDQSKLVGTMEKDQLK